MLEEGDFESTGDAQFLIRASGGVGIGTNAPGAQLEVNTLNRPDSIIALRVRHNGDGLYTIQNSANAAGRSLAIHHRGANRIIDAYYDDGGWQRRFSVDYDGTGYFSGNVGIGTTAPDTKLHVVGAGGNTWIGAGIAVIAVNSNGNAGHLGAPVAGVYGLGVSGYAGYFDGDLCYTGSFNTCSDARFKRNVAPISSALGLVTKLQGVRYDWRRDEFPDRNFADKRQLGFIAQEIKEVLPELIGDDGKGFLTVDYVKLTPVLVEAIKEQQEQIKSQQEQIDKLTSLVNSLVSAGQTNMTLSKK